MFFRNTVLENQIGDISFDNITCTFPALDKDILLVIAVGDGTPYCNGPSSHNNRIRSALAIAAVPTIPPAVQLLELVLPLPL